MRWNLKLQKLVIKNWSIPRKHSKSPDIPENGNLIEVLADVHFLMMSSIEFDILETSSTVANLLGQGKIKEGSSELKKLEELVSSLDFE